MANEQVLAGAAQTDLGEGYVLYAPGLTGTVRLLDTEEPATRGAEGYREPELREVFAQNAVSILKVLELEVTGDAAPEAGSRAGGMQAETSRGEDGFALQLPRIQADAATVLLYTDEAGCSRWILPEGFDADAVVEAEPAGGTRGGAGAALTFHLPRGGAPLQPELTAEEKGTRSALSVLGKRVVRVLAWAAGPLTGLALQAAARKWDRAYALRSFPFMPDSPEPDWRQLADGRCLLFIHGTISSSFGGFSGLDDGTEHALLEAYGGRVFGFDHPTLRHSPRQNAEELTQMLAERLPGGGRLDVDVVTHSRGGLVLRALSLLEAEAGPRLAIRKAVLVASPNLGTVLADSRHCMDYVDRLTNLLGFLPENVFSHILDAILGALKLLHHAAVNYLPGLASMQPRGKYLAKLNLQQPAAVDYCAIAADFTPLTTPSLGGVLRWSGNQIVDHCFEEANDMVVPQAGSWSYVKDEPWIAQQLKLGQADGVNHLTYFLHPRVRTQLVAWLAG